MKHLLLIVLTTTFLGAINPLFSQPDLSIGILNRGFASYDQNTGEITGAYFDVINTGSTFTNSFKIRLYVTDSNFNLYNVAYITDTNGQAGSSSTTHTININLNNNPNIPAGKYTLGACADSDSVIVESTENNNCYFVSPNLNDLNYTPNTVSTNNINEQINVLNTYPNPAQNHLTFEQEENKNQTLYIYNINGNLIKTINLNKVKTTINISEFKRGVYFYQTIIEDGSVTNRGKFIAN